MSQALDVCVIGHVTRDRVRRKGRRSEELPGGTAYYAALAYRRLGLATALVTRLRKRDESALLGDLRDAGVAVISFESPETTTFENVYAGKSPDERHQSIVSLASPFRPEDAAAVKASLYHLGPLTRGDMSVAFLEHLSARGGRIALDTQGFLRPRRQGLVVLEDWPEKWAGLARAHVVKAEGKEAEILTGEPDPERAARKLARLGPEEVVVTLGAAGSIVLADGRLHRVPAFSPRRVEDATGCGDTYFAGYLFRRLGADNAAEAGRFAAALATLKLERLGPVPAGEVEALLKGTAPR